MAAHTQMASKLLLLVVFVFDLIAFGLAVAAEQRRSTVSFLVVGFFFFFNFLRILWGLFMFFFV